MSNKNKKMAVHKIVNYPEGVRFEFYCDLSGMLMYTTSLYKVDNYKLLDEILEQAWEKEGSKNLNMCHKCGAWVSDIMFNADVLNCVKCTPWEEIPMYCSKCGSKTVNNTVFCQSCGARLMYGGEDNVSSG